jgi:hypothetical protein
MRIRKSASRLLGSTYPLTAAPAPDAAHPFEPPPPPMPFMAHPCAAPESLAGSSISIPTATATGETCELSRSPWDLIAELTLSDPQVSTLHSAPSLPGFHQLFRSCSLCLRLTIR